MYLNGTEWKNGKAHYLKHPANQFKAFYSLNFVFLMKYNKFVH